MKDSDSCTWLDRSASVSWVVFAIRRRSLPTRRVSSAKTGITVGNIYACGALGSIFGTFLTGFWLIGQFGCRQVIWMTSGVLVLMAVLVAGGQRAFRAARSGDQFVCGRGCVEYVGGRRHVWFRRTAGVSRPVRVKTTKASD